MEIVPVTSSKQMGSFVKLPWKIYKGDPNWVPPIISEFKKLLNPKINPFFEHSEAQLFLARKANETVGRIAAIVNYNHIEVHNEQVGFFGFFETIEDYEVAQALFEKAGEWLRVKGMKVMRGPVNPSTNDECGLLIQDFTSPPVIMMTYNPRYYQEIIERFGFQQSKDLYAYFMLRSDLERDTPPERLERLSALIKKRGNIVLRNPNMKRFSQEVLVFRNIYNRAWEKNWGFIPWTDKEFDYLAKTLKTVVDPELVFIAEVNGEPVGFSLSIPDVNQAIKRINGRLFPFGIVKLLWYSRKIDTLRIAAMGVIEEYRNVGIDVLFYYETFRLGLKKGYVKGEMSWILEDNLPMNRILENIGARVYKVYRLYDYKI